MDLTEIDRALKAGLQSLAAVSPIRLSEWAEQNFYLSAESSYVEQRWTAYPYQRDSASSPGSFRPSVHMSRQARSVSKN